MRHLRTPRLGALLALCTLAVCLLTALSLRDTPASFSLAGH